MGVFMSKNYDFLGERIRKLRHINNCTQEELGKVLNLPKQSISRIEKGKRRVSSQELEEISKFFKTPDIFILKEGWIDETYKDSIPDNKWDISIPSFVENFLYGLEEYLDSSLSYKRFNLRTAKKIIKGTIKALNEISQEYDKEK